MTSTSQLNGIFYIIWQECMWWYWRHNQRSSSSLQKTTGPILPPKDAFGFCIQNITGIQVFFYISTEEVRSFEPMLVERFKDSRTLPGTRLHHCFRVSQNYECILHCRVSGNKMLASITLPQSVDVRFLQIGKYVLCLSEKDWFCGIIINIQSSFNNWF